MVPPAGFRDSWRTVRGLRLHALESVSSPSPPPPASASPSPAVALLPGLVTASRSMVPLARALTAKGIQVRILDPPGFGYSDKPRRSLSVGEQAALVAEWLAASYGAPVQLLGNSFGTQVVAAVAAGHPHAVARLILLSPTMSPDARRRLRWLATLPAPETPFSPRRESRWRVRLLGRVHRALGDQPSLRVLNVAEYCCASLPRAIGTLRMAARDPIDRALPRIGAPVLVIRAEHDRLSSPGWAGRLAALAPDGQVAHLPGAGHDVFHRAPDTVAAVAAPFLVSGAGSQVARSE